MKITLNSGEHMEASWVQQGRTDVHVQMPPGSFSDIASRFENASALSWAEGEENHDAAYTAIRHMSLDEHGMYIILHQEEA